MSSSAKKKKAVKEFIAITGASESTAKQVLDRTNYSSSTALDHYYSNRDMYPADKPVVKTGNVKKCNAVFSKYAGTEGEEVDVMFGESMGRFFQDVGLNPEGAETLQLAYFLQCVDLGEVGREEFVKAFTTAGCDSLAGMKQCVATQVAALKDVKKFRDFWKWLFDFYNDDKGRKVLSMETAVEAWTLVLKDRFGLLDEWNAFIQDESKLEHCSKDMWCQLYEFVIEVKSDLSNFDEDGAWPYVIDSFVEHVQEKREKE